ncbi:MAG: SBBP repeat-containing protein [Anaerolineae bacterium]
MNLPVQPFALAATTSPRADLKLNRFPPLFLVLILTLAMLFASQPLPRPPSTASTLSPAFADLPLWFVPNAGQAAANVRFQAPGANGALFFTPAEVVLSLPAQSGSPQNAAVLRLRFEGANPTPEVIAFDRLPGIVNYLIGDDPAQWRANLPTYAGLTYRQLYPGIDLHYEGAAGALKGTYRVAPGADPGYIRWRYDGATGVRMDEASGDLLIDLPAATDKQASRGAGEQGRIPQSPISNPQSPIVERAPLAWQTIGGQRQPVSVHYAIAADGSIGFALGSYDPAYPLILDPTLDYSTYLGGVSVDHGRDIAVDAAGNAYVTGSTASSNFPTANPFQAANAGSSDAFVAKLNPDGSTLLYATYLGGNQADSGAGIAVDAAGNVYVTGQTASSNFPTVNPVQGANRGSDDAFIAKLNPTGSTLLYATYLGGIFDDFGFSIAVDAAGNAYVTGLTASSNFLTVNPLQPALDGSSDAFVTKLNPTGSALVYSTYLGGDEVEAGYGIAVDAAGNAYVTGYTHALNFPTVNPLQPTFGGYWDAFVTKINPAGSALVYSTFLGGWWYDYGYDIAVDPSGNAYVTGFTTSSDFPTVNPLQPVAGGGGRDAFVTKVNSTGSALVYSTYLGGNGTDDGQSIAADTSGNAFVAGVTASSNFPTANPLQSVHGGGLSDAFVAKLNPAGSAFGYATYLGGSGDDLGLGIAVDASGNAYLTGSTASGNFPTANPLQAANAGGNDAFVARIAASGDPPANLAVNKVSSVSVANVGQTIAYTYTVTNLGGVTLTGLSAHDDPLGPISLDASSLAPGQSASGVATYTVQMSDLPGPLTNTVTVSGTPPTGPIVTAGDSVSVAVVTASITIVKQAEGVHDFGFSGDLGDFVLSSGGGQNSRTFPNLLPGSYTVAEDPASFPDPFWALIGLACRDGSGQPLPVTVDWDNLAATIPLGTGQQLTCTFQNQRGNVEGEEYFIFLPLIRK